MAHEDEHGYTEELEEVPVVSNARDGQEKDEAMESFIEEKLHELNYNTLLEENNGLGKALLRQKIGWKKSTFQMQDCFIQIRTVLWVLNERQRNQIAEHITNAQTVDEAKTIYETPRELTLAAVR